MIHLEEITNKNIWKVCTLEVMEQQKNFVAENVQSLAEAYATRNEGNHGQQKVPAFMMRLHHL